MKCVDLKATFGEHYRITVDEAADCPSRNTDPWLWIIPCKYGEIYPHGDEILSVMVTAKQVAFPMRSWLELDVHQDADDVVVFNFHVDHFEKVAKQVQAKRRRQISPEQRERLLKLSREHSPFRNSASQDGIPAPKNERSGVGSIDSLPQSEIVANQGELCQ